MREKPIGDEIGAFTTPEVDTPVDVPDRLIKEDPVDDRNDLLLIEGVATPDDRRVPEDTEEERFDVRGVDFTLDPEEEERFDVEREITFTDEREEAADLLTVAPLVRDRLLNPGVPNLDPRVDEPRIDDEALLRPLVEPVERDEKPELDDRGETRLDEYDRRTDGDRDFVIPLGRRIPLDRAEDRLLLIPGALERLEDDLRVLPASTGCAANSTDRSITPSLNRLIVPIALMDRPSEIEPLRHYRPFYCLATIVSQCEIIVASRCFSQDLFVLETICDSQICLTIIRELNVTL